MNKPVTTNEIMQHRAPSGVAASQATTIEQSRAIAQVQGALVVARQNPRDTIAATHRMREACSHMALAEHAFFRFPRDGQTISGPTIHLATELARCWGNIDYGITELARDDIKGESEMLAHAWDQETNARIINSFIVPHRRDTRKGPKMLTDARDLYENNANMGARRLRECIFRVLPVSFREEAKELCAQTLQHGGGVPIEQRREKLLEAFTSIGVTRKQVEKKAGRAADRLTAHDVGQLGIIFKSIQRGEISKAEEFPDDTAAELTHEIMATAEQAKAEPEPAGAHDPETGEVVQEGPEGITTEPSQEAAEPAGSAQEEITQPDLISPATVADLTEDARNLVMELQEKARGFDKLKALDTWFLTAAKTAMDEARLHQVGRDAVAQVKALRRAKLVEESR